MQSVKSVEKKSKSKCNKKKDNRKCLEKNLLNNGNGHEECNISNENQNRKKLCNLCMKQSKPNINETNNINREKNKNDNENASKITAASALINDLGVEKKNNDKIIFTDKQKETIEKILDKIFSTNISNQNNDKNNNVNNNDNVINKLLNKNKNNKNGLKILDIFNQAPLPDLDKTLSDDDDEDDEYVEYVFKPRQYFLISMCQVCKKNLKDLALPCRGCFMTFYCSIKHMTDDKQHTEFCSVLKSLATNQGGHIFNGTNNLAGEPFRNFRVQMLRKCEDAIKRDLELFEKEIILYPKICCEETCREWRYTHLTTCKNCYQVAFCKNNPNHLKQNHKKWCNSFSIMAQLIRLQGIYGEIAPDMPNEIIRNVYKLKMTMKNILDILYKDNKIEDDLSFANATQVATAPLTVWYGLSMFDTFRKSTLTVHIVGAEFNFEANSLQKWEYFLLHLTPTLKELNIIFIGPELIVPGVSFDLLSKSRMCKTCKTEGRKVNFKFENSLYHDYKQNHSFIVPDLICFFNPGLHRLTGFDNIDTWAETIRASTMIKCPIIVTSYTEYESPLDLKRIIFESQRSIEIIMPSIKNPFSSTKPERNFISDDIVPLIFKNFYIFIVQ